MVRYFFEEGTISEQDFKDAERIHYQHLNEHNVFEGKEEIPYGDDLAEKAKLVFKNKRRRSQRVGLTNMSRN